MLHLAWEIVIIKSQALFCALGAALGVVSHIPVSTVEVLLALASDMWNKTQERRWVDERTEYPG